MPGDASGAQPGGKARGTAAGLADRMAGFRSEVCAFAGGYPEEMLAAFFNYWSETNKPRTKMRFELERTWETSRRLATWAKKEQDYAQNRRNHGGNYRDAKQEANDYAVSRLMERIAARRNSDPDEGEEPF